VTLLARINDFIDEFWFLDIRNFSLKRLDLGWGQKCAYIFYIYIYIYIYFKIFLLENIQLVTQTHSDIERTSAPWTVRENRTHLPVMSPSLKEAASRVPPLVPGSV